MKYCDFINTLEENLQSAGKTFVETYNKYIIANSEIQDVEPTKEIFINLFGTAPMGKTKFYKLKAICLHFLNYLETQYNIDLSKHIQYLDNNIIYSDIALHTSKQTFFKNIKDLVDFFYQIADENKLHKSSMVPYIALCVLYWYGLDNENIITLKKDNIVYEDCAIKFNNLTIKIDPISINILQEFSNAEYYRAFPRGRLQLLGDSEFLFRTQTTPQFALENMHNWFQKIKNLSQAYGKIITKQTLYKNYIFTEAEKSNNPEELIKSLICNQDRGVLKTYRDEYYQWILWKNIQ